MLDRIQASVGQLRTVTDSVAHDMKSPVTAIRGRLEVALSTQDEGHWRELVAEAIDGLDRLSHLLNTTLDLAEAEPGALHLNRESLNLSALVRQQIDLYQPALAAHNHSVGTEVEDGVLVDGDLPLIHRVMSNLFDNELAHLPNGCMCRSGCTRRIATRIWSSKTTVRDSTADLRSHVFERFVKGKHSQGRGLGLAFVNAVAQAHGGSVKISDGARGGAAITVSLPIPL